MTTTFFYQNSIIKGAPRLGNYKFRWGAIKHNSTVLISVAEARQGSGEKFIGDARPMVAGSICPYDGGVDFTVWWYGDFPYLDLSIDYVSFNLP